MASIPYTQNTPVATNAPSQDVNNLTQNTNSVFNIWNVDHKTFTSTLAGQHKQVTMTNQGNPGVLVNQGALYCDQVNGDGVSWPLWSYYDGGVQQISLINYPVTTGANGIIPLAGGLILQYGAVETTTGTTTVNYNGSGFPNNNYMVVVTPQTATIAGNQGFSAVSISKTQFTLKRGAGFTGSVYFNWIAIGN